MTVMTNAGLVLKDSQGNKGIVKPLTDNDIIKIANAITDVGQVVDPATHMPIEATTASVGVVQLATAQDITNGTAGKVVDAQELNNFAQTLPSVNGVTDVSSGDNSNQIVVSKFGGSKTLTIDNVEHADNADEATHATQADTATSANSVAWANVSGKPSTFAPATHNHDDRYYTESEIDTKLSGKSDTTHNHDSAYLGITAKAVSAKSADSVAWNNVSGKPSTFTPSDHDHSRYGMYFNDVCADTNTGWYESRYKGVGDDNQTHLYINDYFGIHFHTAGYFDVNGKAIIHEGNIGSQSVNYANTSGRVRTQSNSDWYMNCNWDGSYFQTDCISNDGARLPINVQKANYADSAGSVAWTNVSDRPTKVSQFTNDSGYITTDGAAYPRRVGGVTMNFNWSGQGGQPTWLWGGEDGTNMYVYNPANFSVNYATNSGYTNWLRTSSHADHLLHTEWDGSYFWTYVTAGDGGYRAVRVERSNSSGWADNAGNGVHSSGGSWIRFNNGIQLVWQTGVPSNTWTNFSVAFNATTYMSIMAIATDTTTNSINVKVHSYDTAKFYVSAYNNDNNNLAVACSCSIVAFGTWK